MKLQTVVALSLFVAASGCDSTPTGPAKPAGSASASAKAAASTSSSASAMASASAAPAASGSADAEEEAALLFMQPTDGAQVFPKFEVVASMTEGIELKTDDGTEVKLVALPIDKALEAGAAVPEGVTPTEIEAKEGGHASIELEKGKHKLTLQFLADGKSWRPELSETIEVEVVDDQGERSVAWLEPKDGATVKSPVTMKFDVKGMKVVPAGEDPKNRTSGHHHVLIGKESHPVGMPIPADDTHKHFGKGQTETELELPKGKHTLGLQFADGTHASYGEDMAATITITVE